jgi:TRAP transporter TAXI family solute receptor
MTSNLIAETFRMARRMGLHSALCLSAWLAVSTVQAAELSLCTARADGNYYAAGEIIRSRTNAERLNLALRETAGSVDNLGRLARRECDAAIVQLDAYLVYQEANRWRRLELARPNYLYEEFVHLICRRDAGLDSIEDLANGEGKHEVLIGEPESGSAATWRYFTILDPDYAKTPARTVGGAQALTEVRKPGGASCMLYVSGLRSKFSATVSNAGDTLALVPVDDPDLDEARFAGERIYRFRKIPAGTYPALQATDRKRDLETLTVGATLFVTQSWAEANYDANAYLVEVILRTKPEILERVAPR